MRKVVVLNRVTLDGFFAGPNGEFDWFIHDAEIDKDSHEIIDADTLLLGRETYHHLENFWPHAADDPNASDGLKAMADEINQMSKVVFSTTRKEVTWENSRLVHSDLIREVKTLKQGPGTDLLILGSGTLVQQLANEGLIDEYVLIVTPLVLGTGRPLFKDAKTLPLALVSAKSYQSGNVLLHYKYTDEGK